MSRKIVVQKLNKKYGALLKRIWRCMPLYIMMVPGICYLVINNYLPLTGLQLAFKKFQYAKGIWKSPWNGIKNFKFLFQTNDAWALFRNTIGYNLLYYSFSKYIQKAEERVIMKTVMRNETFSNNRSGI